MDLFFGIFKWLFERLRQTVQFSKLIPPITKVRFEPSNWGSPNKIVFQFAQKLFMIYSLKYFGKISKYTASCFFFLFNYLQYVCVKIKYFIFCWFSPLKMKFFFFLVSIKSNSLLYSRFSNTTLNKGSMKMGP